MAKAKHIRVLQRDSSAMIGILDFEESLTPSSVATVSCVDEDFTVAGVSVGDIVLGVEGPAVSNAVDVIGGRVKAVDTVTLKFCNPTAGGAVPTAGTYKILILRA